MLINNVKITVLNKTKTGNRIRAEDFMVNFPTQRKYLHCIFCKMKHSFHKLRLNYDGHTRVYFTMFSITCSANFFCACNKIIFNETYFCIVSSSGIGHDHKIMVFLNDN